MRVQSDWFHPFLQCFRSRHALTVASPVLLLASSAAIGLLSIGQAAAQDAEEVVPAQSTVSAPAGTQNAQSRRSDKVCESEVVTGSRMKKRVCYTPEQWAARERAGRELTRGLDNRPVGALGGE
ncbi:hypothetical protein LDO26_04750 [Luteimonas sp. BDR2-5]|uniref:hypothetical protein n=1 Tax=Proluteimonas luteida TaxID=2878685 RepID=UPI001E57AC8B|nr:hypothetical protein [Luteimonas sp. BDR2-5]MCD9027521.1 hypothetical protein [Luteimonas sp. BDR2-5]